MLTPTAKQRIYLAAEPVDMRGGFDRLAGRVLTAGLDLYAGHLFVFVSRRRTHLKVLTWDGSGLVVLYKRLGRGKFVVPTGDGSDGPATLNAVAFAELLRGTQTVGVVRSKSSTRSRGRVDSRGRV
ncbi:MAG: IS66 family insertion sequence element accessory protein TnpB [bacterium]|nr:IS66 family insertion sequence element accessory protein TnpB [bacterium]